MPVGVHQNAPLSCLWFELRHGNVLQRAGALPRGGVVWRRRPVAHPAICVPADQRRRLTRDLCPDPARATPQRRRLWSRRIAHVRPRATSAATCPRVRPLVLRSGGGAGVRGGCCRRGRQASGSGQAAGGGAVFFAIVKIFFHKYTNNETIILLLAQHGHVKGSGAGVM